MIKCLIFDCDGTLVDSEYLCNLGLEIILREYGVEASAEQMVLKYRGGKLANILNAIEDEYQINLKESFVTEYRELVDQLFEKDLVPFDGVVKFLEQNALPVCVASSGPIKKIKTSIQITGLAKYFGDNLFSSYEINSWKPEPNLFLYAAKKMGFKPSECLVIEDSTLGIQAGLAAGMRTVLFDPLKLHLNIDSVRRIEMIDELKLISLTDV
jgi:HAD superfamily hydrolase (TIGR01509 family)